jgi:hypothetical protein
MAGGYEYPDLKYRFSLVDIREFEAEEFIGCQVPEERVLALLCRSPDPRQTVRDILITWESFPHKRWRTLLEQLMIISRLRRLERVVTEEVQLMPLPIELILENEVFQEWAEKGFQKGRGEGKAEALSNVLNHRFGSVPSWAESKIRGADPATIDRWIIQALDSRTLEETLS